MKEKDFSRNRILTLPRLIIAQINRISATLTVELYRFFKSINFSRITKQAFSLARYKIRPKAYQFINSFLIQRYYSDVRHGFKKWKGRHLLAIDGSYINLPAVERLRKFFGTTMNQGGNCINPQGLASVLYDVQNSIIHNAILTRYRSSERDLAMEQLEYIKTNLSGQKVLILFDRGYPSLPFIWSLFENKIDFVMRIKKDFCEETAEFEQSGKKSKVIEIDIRKHRNNNIKNVLAIAERIGYKIKLRIIGKEVNNDYTYFITNIMNKTEATDEEISNLYLQREKIENEFKAMKNFVEVENFSTKKLKGIYQEFYAKMVTMNLANILMAVAQMELNEELKDNSEKKYKINRNVAYGLIKHELPNILIDLEDESKFDMLINEIKKSKVQIIPGRNYKRTHSARNIKFHINYRGSY